MLDLRKLTPIGNMRMSDLAARQEVRAMVEALSLPPRDEAAQHAVPSPRKRKIRSAGPAGSLRC